MGLEDIVNMILAPVEKLAGAVYGAFCEKEMHKKENGMAVYTLKEPEWLKKSFGVMRDDYRRAKSVILDYTVKPMDRLGDYVYKKLDSYVFTPLTKAYQNHPFGTLLLGSLMLLYYFP